jgi:DNA-binding PadR family transcriptional regulator
MNPACSREAERKENQQRVMSNLKPLIVLFSETDEGIHGYGIIEKTKKLFGVLLGPSTVYPACEDLEKQGILRPTNATNKKTGKPIVEYHPVEPQADEYVQTYLKGLGEFNDIVQKLGRNIRDKSSVQVGAIALELQK